MITLVPIHYLFFVILSAFTLEILYSIYKKDGAYSLSGTVGNLVHGIFLVAISIMCISLYAQYFSDIFSWLNHRYTPISALSFMACLLFVDFMYYIFHRIHHSFKFLRKFHRVHHGDTKFNLTTAFRISLIEQVYILLFLTPLILIGYDPYVTFLAAFFLVIYQFFCHSHYLKLPRFFDLLLITPSNHKIHHDSRRENQDSNYGAIFSIWDRMFGTFKNSSEKITFGIPGYKEDNPFKMEIDPLLRP